VGQSDRPITTQYKEHLRYIKNNNPISSYAMHILKIGMNSVQQKRP